MKLVLDTNVLISAIFWQGTPHEILISIEKGTFALCITPVLLDELKDVLSRPKFSYRIKECNTSREELLTAIIDVAELYPDRKIAPVIKDDLDDDCVLACALTSGAQYIITGDPHLLKLKDWSGILIMTPPQFLDLIE